MASFLRKAARMNLVAMDFVLQVTVVELNLETLDADAGLMLSFELSRGTKTSGLLPKLVSTTRSEWGDTMQVILTLFLDRRSGRFQDKEYKLRLVQRGKDQSIIMAPALATFTLDASLYAHLGAGPSVEQPVDLFAPKLNGPGGYATVRLRVRCCEQEGGGAPLGRSASAPSVTGRGRGAAPSSGSGLPPRGPIGNNRPSLPPLQSGQLVGSSFGFSMSGSESRHSVVSTGSSAFSTPSLRRPGGRPWSNEDLDLAGSVPSTVRSRRSFRSMRSKVGSKSFNDLDDSGHSGRYTYTPSSSVATTKRSSRSLRSLRSGSSMSFNAFLSTAESAGSQFQSPGQALRREKSSTTGVLPSESSRSGSSSKTNQGTATAGRRSGAVPYDRTTTVGYNRLLARFTKGPSPKGRVGQQRPETVEEERAVDSSSTATANSSNSRNVGYGTGSSLANKRRIFTFSSAGLAPMMPSAVSLPGGSSANVNAAAVAVGNENGTPAGNGSVDDSGHSSGNGTAVPSPRHPVPAPQPSLPVLGSLATMKKTVFPASTRAAAIAPPPAPASNSLKGQPPKRSGHGSGNVSGSSSGSSSGSDKRDKKQQQQQQQRHRWPGALQSLSISSFSSGWGTSRTPRVGPPGGGGGQAGVGGASAARGGVWRQQHSDESAGGGSAVAAPLSSATAGGGGVGGGGGKWAGDEELLGMENRLLHLEAALVRSELDLCRAKTELSVARQEAHELQVAKEAEEQARPASEDISALYHALEGSVVLLQIASDKMLHLEHTINKYRSTMPERVFNELQECVTHDAVVLSPMRLSQQHLQRQQRA